MTSGDRRVAVIGGGTMGSGIAQVLAQAGAEVTLIERGQAELERALKMIRGSLSRLAAKGKISNEEIESITARIVTSTSFEETRNSSFVIEAVYENVDLKRDVASKVTGIIDDGAVFATNTSSISVTVLAAAASRPERVVGLHFFNPVPVMQLVEVVRAERTSDETLKRAVALASFCDKIPVEVNDYPGFVSNRVLAPMLNEAVFCLSEGVATRDAIDEVMKLGMAHPMGPLALADLIGLDVLLAILEVLQRDLGDDKYRPAPLLRRMVAAGKLGAKSGEGFYRYG